MDAGRGVPLGYVYNEVVTIMPTVASTHWTEVDAASSSRPPVRFGHSAVQIGAKMIVYGGRFEGMQDDVYVLNTTYLPGEPQSQKFKSEFQTLYVMIAVLCIMIMLFWVFVFALRRGFRASQQPVVLSGS